MFTWDVDPVLYDGIITIRYYGLILGLVLVLGFVVWRWQMRRGGHDEEIIGQFVVYGVLGVLAGSRLGHCIFYDFDRCFNPVTNVFKVWEGGLASHGATIGLALALALFAWRKKLHVAETTDRFSMCAAIGAILVRVANFINSEIVGAETGGNWGVRFPRYDRVPLAEVPLRHPSQLYEVALGLIVLSVLFLTDRHYGEKRRRGLLSSLFLITYFCGRFVVEFFKERQVLATDSFLTMGQWLSLPGIAIGGYWLFRVLHDPAPRTIDTRDSKVSSSAGKEKATKSLSSRKTGGAGAGGKKTKKSGKGSGKKSGKGSKKK